MLVCLPACFILFQRSLKSANLAPGLFLKSLMTRVSPIVIVPSGRYPALKLSWDAVGSDVLEVSPDEPNKQRFSLSLASYYPIETLKT
jgi:hypothetical protein